jgi:hypothetical protein
MTPKRIELTSEDHMIEMVSEHVVDLQNLDNPLQLIPEIMQGNVVKVTEAGPGWHVLGHPINLDGEKIPNYFQHEDLLLAICMVALRGQDIDPIPSYQMKRG